MAVRLSEEVHGSKAIDRAHRFIEKWILFRRQCFKNKPRVNFMLIRAAWSTVVLSLLAFAVGTLTEQIFSEKSLLENLKNFIGGHGIKGVFAILGAVSLSYWNMSSIFNRQWTYCSDLYNKIIQESDPDRRKQLRLSLAIDLLVLDLWAHRSFSDFFEETLRASIRHYYASEKGTLENTFAELGEGKMTENAARKYLEAHLRYLSAEQTKIDQSDIHKVHGHGLNSSHADAQLKAGT